MEEGAGDIFLISEIFIYCPRAKFSSETLVITRLTETTKAYLVVAVPAPTLS